MKISARLVAFVRRPCVCLLMRLARFDVRNGSEETTNLADE